MNMKKVLCLAAALSLTSHALAMEIYKGKVLSQKVWSSDGGKAKISPSKAMRGQKMHMQNQPYEHTWAQVFSGSTKVNQPFEIENTNGVFIQNDSDETHEYRTIQSVCSETSEATFHCVHYFDEIELSPGGYLSDDLRPVLEMTYSKPGSYKIISLTSYGEGSNPSSYSESIGVMTVS
jgi:hypothetical protein